MPTKTKAQLYDELVELGEFHLALAMLLEDDKFEAEFERVSRPLAEDEESGEDDPDETTIAELLQYAAVDWMSIADSFYSSGPGSRGPYTGIPKSLDFFSCCLQAPDRAFRHMFRVSRDTFDRLVAVLALNPIFESTGKRPQRHVKYQLGTFLVRYASLGSDTLWTAQKLSIGFGSVFNYCRRVTKAIRQLRDQHVGWPTAERKLVIAAAMGAVGFHKCLGCCDGSLIRFTQQPSLIGPGFLTRKKFFGTNIQVVCDHCGRIIAYELGWPGSVPDVKVWKNSHLWRHRHDYFKDGEYILVDKGYPSSPFVLRPFSEPEIQDASTRDKKRMRAFNAHLSSIRIMSEHVYGRLKGRFPSLKEMGIHDNIGEMYKVIEALIVLHNICIDFDDRPEHIWAFDPKDPIRDDEEVPPEVDPDTLGERIVGQTENPAHETDAWLKDKGQVMRQNLLDELFPVENFTD